LSRLSSLIEQRAALPGAPPENNGGRTLPTMCRRVADGNMKRLNPAPG